MRSLLFAALLAPTAAFAWPIQLTGTVQPQAPVPVTVGVDLLLYSNGYGWAQLDAGAYVEQVRARWAWAPNQEIAISIAGQPFIGGAPNQGCLTGQATRPTPAFLQALIPFAQITYLWDVCVVP